MSDKTYAKGIFAKQRKYSLGISIKVDEFTKFLKENANGKGYVNLDIGEKKTVGKYGDTHWVALNDWKPESKETTITPIEEDNNPLPF